MQCSCIDASMELNCRTCWRVVRKQQMSLVINICGLSLSGSWLYRATDWTVSVVGVLLLRAHRLGIHCLTAFVTVTQSWVSTLSSVNRRHTFLMRYWWQNVLSALEIFSSMRYINLHFTYLLFLLTTHRWWMQFCCLSCSLFQGKIYVYDRVFKANSAQEAVYAITAKPIVKGTNLNFYVKCNNCAFTKAYFIHRITEFPCLLNRSVKLAR